MRDEGFRGPGRGMDMSERDWRMENGLLTVRLRGCVDSANAPELEAELTARLGETAAGTLELDCGELEYISSAGLRVILNLKKAGKTVRVTNASPEVYEILDTTGFTELIQVQRALREISLEGCEIVGSGANGTVYRVDPETVVKAYRDPDALPEIRRERELARKAFILGAPTAISYDVVRIREGGYGSVFELLEARSLARLLREGELTAEEAARMSADLLKLIHSIRVKPEELPDMRVVALGWADFLRGYLPPKLGEKLAALIRDVPEEDRMLHGDYHAKNVMVQKGECLLIDMDTLSRGHPVFELASMYNACCGFSDRDHSVSGQFLGIDYRLSRELWERSLALYLGTEDPERLREVEEKAQILGFARLLRRRIRRGGMETEEGRLDIENCKRRLESLLPGVDSLVF